MTFSTTVPVATQSPGLFPAQSNTNFNRLKAIIDADHNFADTSTANEGAHNHVSMIDRAAPGAPVGGTNGMLYSETVSGSSQLRYINSSTTYNITDSTIAISGSQSVPNGAVPVNQFTIYPDPGFIYAGSGWSFTSGSETYTYYNILRSGSNILKVLASNGSVQARPVLVFSSNAILVQNNNTVPQTISWSLILSRVG